MIDYTYLYQNFFVVLRGVPITLKITMYSLFFATPFAFILALCKIHNIKILKQISTVYISFIRSIPSIILILIIYIFLPSFLNTQFKKYNLAINIFDIDNIIYAYIIFSLIATALLAEIFRSAILTVDKGEYDAAIAMGLTNLQTYRRIIIPQAIVVAIPNICNLTIGIIKSSSLVFLISVQDITAIAKISAAMSYQYIESYIDIFIVYVIICGCCQFAFYLLEKYFAKYKTVNQKSIKIKEAL